MHAPAALRVVAATLFLASVFAAPAPAPGPAETAADASTDRSRPKPSGASYDYIVVGTGAGGGPLAANLAQKGFSVLLLEAGDDQTGNINEQTPAFQGRSAEDPTMRWDFFVKQYSDEGQTLKNNHLTWKRADGSLWVGNGSAAPADAKLLGVHCERQIAASFCSCEA